MEMHQIRYFLAVASELNFTRAADKCHVTQPALTRAIRLLEEELGGPLLYRERAHTRLTELGKIVLPHLEHVWEAANASKKLAKDLSTAQHTPLKVGIMCTVAPDQIVALIGSVQLHHQDIELQLSDANAWELEAALLDGKLEAAIYCLPGKAPDERTHVTPLFREQMLIAIRRDHRLASGTAIRVKDLDGECYIHRMNCEFAGYADPAFAAQNVKCKAVYWSERDDWTLAMVAAGVGWAFMPAHSVKHPGVAGLPLTEPEFWRTVNLVTVRGRPHSHALGALLREAMRIAWFGAPALPLAEKGGGAEGPKSNAPRAKGPPKGARRASGGRPVAGRRLTA